MKPHVGTPKISNWPEEVNLFEKAVASQNWGS